HGYGKGEGQLSRDTFPAPIRDQLQNGIRTLLTPFDERRRASVVLYLKTGSRFESPSENGLSHFLEHMLFRGTEEHPSAHALSTAFEDLGGSLEATTAADHGTLEINVPQENLSRALDLMGGVVRAPLLKDLELERGIIREEVLGDLSEEG